MDNYNYPPGSDTPDAPWNEIEYPDKEIEVTVSITLSKTVKINVNDYIIETDQDEDGKYDYYDFTECDLKGALEAQVTLPQNLAEFTERIFNYDLNLKSVDMPKYLKDAINDCKDWNIDDYEIICEE